MSTINVTDKATPKLNALIRSIENPIPGLMIAGRAVANVLRAHYREKHAKEPNKLGGKRQNYWLGVRHSVNNPQPSGAAQVTVSISHPSIMQKIKGGTITAKRVSMLTIPVDKEAYGRRASVLERALNIKLFVIEQGGRAFLAGRTDSAAPLRIFYVLKRSVTQKPDPTALPPEQTIHDTATEAFTKWVERTAGT
ncbi:MAG: hypothetical protein AB9869_01230 [Verrucomicrobiia bacterium]